MAEFPELRLRSRAVALVLCSLIVSALGLQTAPAQAGSSDVTWSLAATGDTVITRRIAVYETDPAFMSLVKVVRATDAAFTNLASSAESVGGLGFGKSS
jgi:hypothetical protein